MTGRTDPTNQGIIVSGGSFTANDVAVGQNASINKEVHREAPLSSVPSLILRGASLPVGQEARRYDVFISHASEDKAEIARPLATALRHKGVDVWIDEFELHIGDSIRREIDRGLANTRLGIVVLSPAFLSKGWTNYELDGIMTRAISGEQILLPIWHNVTKQEVVDFSPSLAGKVARNTATHSLEDIAQEIAELLQKR